MDLGTSSRCLTPSLQCRCSKVRYEVVQEGSAVADTELVDDVKLNEYLDTLQHDGSNSGILAHER